MKKSYPNIVNIDLGGGGIPLGIFSENVLVLSDMNLIQSADINIMPLL